MDPASPSLLDFGTTGSGGASTLTPDDPGNGLPAGDPTLTIFDDPAIQGAITGIANGLGQTLQRLIAGLPVQLGIQTPAPVSPFGSSLMPLLLVGGAVYLLSSGGGRRRSSSRRRSRR